MAIGDDRPTRGGRRTTTGSRDESYRAASRTGTPLGVPKDYSASVQRSWTPSPGRSGRVDLGALRYTHEQAPRYFDGDEWKPAGESTDSIVERQQKLVLAGYLDPDAGFALGRWDGPTRKAYQYLLEDANAAGITADMMLYRAAQSVPIGGEGGGRGRGGGFTIDPETGELVPIPEEQFVAPAFEVQVPNRDDVRRVVRDASINKLGIALSEKEIDDIARIYGWKVMAVQADAYSQEVERMRQEFEFEQGRGPAPTTKQITSVEAPSWETVAEEEFKRRDPGGYQATQLADYSEAFFEAIGAR